MIDRVILKDFKSHEASVVQFHEGTNALLGHNGAGKSSVLQAIGLCIFGFTPKRVKVSEWVRKGAKYGEAQVVFKSPVDGKEYKVVRRIGQGSKAEVLDENDVVLAEKQAPVYKLVKSLLGLEDDADLARIFQELVGIPQGQLTSSFLLTDADRKAVFDRVLGIESFKEAYDNAKDIIKAAEQRVHGEHLKVVRFESLLEGHDERVKAKEDKDKELATAQSQAEAKGKEVAHVQKHLSELEAKEKASAELRREHQEKRVELTRLESQEPQFKQAVQSAQDSAKWLEDNRSIIANAKSSQAFIEENKAQFEALQTTRTRIPLLESAAEAAKTAHATAIARQSKLEEELGPERDWSKVLEQEADVKKRLDDLNAQNQEAQEELAKANAAVAELPKRRAEKANLEARRAAAQGHTEQVTVARDALKVAEEELSAISARLAAVDAQFDVLATQKCPLLEVQCPKVEGSVEAQRDANKSSLLQRKADLEAKLPGLKDAVTKEAALNVAILNWHNNKERLVEVDEEIKAAELANEKAESLKEQRRELRAQAMEIQKESQQVQEELRSKSAYDATRKQLQELAEGLQGLEKDMQDKTSALQAAQESLNAGAELEASYQSHLATFQQHQALLVKAPEHEARSATLEDASKALDAHVATVQSLRDVVAQMAKDLEEAWTDADAAALVAARDAHRTVDSEFKVLQNNVEHVQKEVNALAAQLVKDEEHVENLTKAKAAYADWKDSLATLTRHRKLIKEAGPHVAKRFVAAVSAVADQYYRELTDGALRELRWDESYDIIVRDEDGHDKSFMNLSGGERVTAALAVRLALLNEVSTIKFAFFDEPTTNLDEDSRVQLANALNKSVFQQLVVISHDNTFSESIHNHIRLNKDGTKSVVEDVPL